MKNKQAIYSKSLEILKQLHQLIPLQTDEKLTAINQNIEDANYILEEA